MVTEYELYSPRLVGREADFSAGQQMCWACPLSDKKEPQSPIQSLFINVLGCFCFNSMTFLWKLD